MHIDQLPRVQNVTQVPDDSTAKKTTVSIQLNGACAYLPTHMHA